MKTNKKEKGKNKGVIGIALELSKDVMQKLDESAKKAKRSKRRQAALLLENALKDSHEHY